MVESRLSEQLIQFIKANDDNKYCEDSENNRIDSYTKKQDISDYKICNVFYPGFVFDQWFFSPVDEINADCSQQVVSKNDKINNPNDFHYFFS
jgi:hypothetical protein